MTNIPVHQPHSFDVAVGARVRACRKERRVSQAALAEAVGITFQQIQKYENGANRISCSKLYEMAQFLGVRMGFLLGEDLTLDQQANFEFLLSLSPDARTVAQTFERIADQSIRAAVADFLKTVSQLPASAPPSDQHDG